jgi:hypothetical protein
MQNAVMGIPKEEAQAILGCTARTLERWTAQGVLRILPGRARRYDEDEVYALKSARERKYTHQELLDTARQAWAASRAAQRRVEELERLLGLHTVPAFEMAADEVRALHLEAEDQLSVPVSGADRINYWADHFLGICDQYLTRVSEVTDDPEPHAVYLKLSNWLLSCRDFEAEQLDREEAVAYVRLRSGRENLRIATFTYLLQKHGKKKAFEVYPTEFEGYHHDVLRNALYL